MAATNIRRARKSDWYIVKPMSEKCEELAVNKCFSLKEMEKIKRGVIPIAALDNKWFVYYFEDENKLYMHRSPTGHCMWIVQFENKGDPYEATTVIAV
jgi:hypothetical protein